MNTIREYVTEYTRHINNEFASEEFGPKYLEQFLLQDTLMLKAINAFHLKPEDLANIIDSIGGAEIYEFKDLNFLYALRELYPLLDLSKPIYDQGIKKEELIAMRNRLFNLQSMNSFPNIAGHSLHMGLVRMDNALGYLLNAEYFIYLEHKLYSLPGADDDYFDYYPGNIFYFNAIIEWFLNSENRIP